MNIHVLHVYALNCIRSDIHNHIHMLSYSQARSSISIIIATAKQCLCMRLSIEKIVCITLTSYVSNSAVIMVPKQLAHKHNGRNILLCVCTSLCVPMCCILLLRKQEIQFCLFHLRRFHDENSKSEKTENILHIMIADCSTSTLWSAKMFK